MIEIIDYENGFIIIHGRETTVSDAISGSRQREKRHFIETYLEAWSVENRKQVPQGNMATIFKTNDEAALYLNENKGLLKSELQVVSDWLNRMLSLVVGIIHWDSLKRFKFGLYFKKILLISRLNKSMDFWI